MDRRLVSYLQFEQYVFLGGKMKVEGPARDARRSDYAINSRQRKSLASKLVDRSLENPLAGILALLLSGRNDSGSGHAGHSATAD